MIKKSIIAKLWLAMLFLLIFISLVLGLGLIRGMENFYYEQVATDLVSEGRAIAAIYEEDRDRFSISDRFDDFSRILNAHIIALNSNEIIVTCSQMLHLSPGTFFREEEITRILQGETIVKRGHQEYFGVQMLSVGIPVGDGKIGEALMIYMPIAPITGTLSELRTQIYWALFIALIITSILALVLSRTLSRPLLKMNEVALNLAKGDYSQRVTVKSADEIGILGSSLNYLSDRQRKLEEMRREFVANVSHELRTPVALIRGYAEAVEDDVAESPEERRSYMKVIIGETNRLQRLVDDLLELSRLQSGAVAIEKEELDLASEFALVEEKFRSLLNEHNILLQIKIGPGASHVYADKFRLEQVLINLVHNAVQYAPGSKLTISSRKVQAGIELTVGDTGPGIPEADLPHIFDRFYRADKSGNRELGGTGIGLSIVKNIMEAHGGDVKVTSREGQGTSFTLLFPKS